jgi:hypothetical protein
MRVALGHTASVRPWPLVVELEAVPPVDHPAVASQREPVLSWLAGFLEDHRRALPRLPISMFTVELTPAKVDTAVEVEGGEIVEFIAAAKGLAVVPHAAPDPLGGKLVSVVASLVLDRSLAAASIASGSTDIHCGLAAFRERCRAKKATLLPRPLPRKTRKKRPPPP